MGKFSVTFQPGGVSVEVDEAQYPYGRVGEPGSILDIALPHGVEIPHACEGAGACGTCHVLIDAGKHNLSEAGDDELDRLEQLDDYSPKSRLACQAVVCGDVTVTIPS